MAQAAWDFVTTYLRPSNFVIMPAPPPRCEKSTGTTITLRWDYSSLKDTSSGGSAQDRAKSIPDRNVVKGYRVYYRIHENEDDDEHFIVCDQERALLVGLEPHTTYRVRVEAICADNSKGPSSDPAYLTTREDKYPLSFFSEAGKKSLDDLNNCLIAAEAVYEDEPQLYVSSILRRHTLGPCVTSQLESHGCCIFFKQKKWVKESTPDVMYIAFRGPRKESDVVLQTFLSGERVVKNFGNKETYLKGLPFFRKLLEEHRENTIFFVGHSIGGVYAIDVTKRMIDNHHELADRIKCVTFGSPLPRAEDESNSMYLEYSHLFYHVVNADDPVPVFPFASYDWRSKVHAIVDNDPDKSNVGRYFYDKRTYDKRPGWSRATVRAMEGKLSELCTNLRELGRPGFEPRAYTLGTVCVLSERNSFGSEECMTPEGYVDYITKRDFDSVKCLEHHRLMKYVFGIVTDPDNCLSFDEDPSDCFRAMIYQSLEPVVTSDEKRKIPVCNCVREKLEVTVTGKNLLYTSQLQLYIEPEQRYVDLELKQVKMHEVIAVTKVTRVGRLTGPMMGKLISEFGSCTFNIHLINHEDFDQINPHARQYECMEVSKLIEQGLACALLFEGNSRTNRMTELLSELETFLYYSNDATSTKRSISRKLVLPYKNPESVHSSLLRGMIEDYFQSIQHNEQKVYEEAMKVLHNVDGVMSADFMFTLSGSDYTKLITFIGKFAMVVGGGCAMMTPAGPALLLGVAEGAVTTAGSVAATSGVGSFVLHYMKSVPFNLRTYDDKLNFVLETFGLNTAHIPRSYYYKEMVIVRKFTSIFERKYGELTEGRTLAASLSFDILIQFFKDEKSWEKAFKEEAEEGYETLGMLDESDRLLYGALLWAIICIHEIRLSLMQSFTLHVVGSKEVGKSTLVCETFGIPPERIVCGNTIETATLIPTVYQATGIKGLKIVDHPACDDLHTMASRLNSHTYRAATHFLILTSLQGLKTTSVLKMLLTWQSFDVPYTIIIPRGDTLVESFQTREALEHELKLTAEHLNEKIRKNRELVKKLRNEKVARGGPTISAGSNPSVVDTAPSLRFEMDPELTFLQDLTEEQVSRLHEEDHSTWKVVSVKPHKIFTAYMRDEGITLDGLGVYDCAAFRGALEELWSERGMPNLRFPENVPVTRKAGLPPPAPATPPVASPSASSPKASPSPVPNQGQDSLPDPPAVQPTPDANTAVKRADSPQSPAAPHTGDDDAESAQPQADPTPQQAPVHHDPAAPGPEHD